VPAAQVRMTVQPAQTTVLAAQGRKTGQPAHSA
jgi:hypothetical protein